MKFKLELAVKPYARCITCKYRNVHCNGISPSALDLLTWSAYMRDIKEHDKLTNAHVADKASVSIKTIERIMALNCEQDIMRDTARRIESVILGAGNQHTCYLDIDTGDVQMQIERLQQQVDYLRLENERKGKMIDKLLDK